MTALAWLIPPLTLLTGWLLWSRLPAASGERDDLLERAAAATIAGIFMTGFLALLLAELGLLRPWALVTALLVACAVLLALRRRAPHGAAVPRRDLIAFSLVVLLAAGTMAPASEEITGGRDEGVYANIAAWVAQRGTLRMHSGALASLAPESRRLFQDRTLFPGFYVGDGPAGEIFPQFMHLHPVYMALGYWLGGPRGLLLVPPIYGVLSLAVLFLFVRRLLGTAPALTAAVVLGLNLAHIWVLRTPFSEGPAQFALMALFWALAAAAEGGGMRWAVVAGLAMGAGFLLRIDATLLLIGILPALAVMQASLPGSGRWIGLFLLLTLALAGWSLLHGWIFATPYISDHSYYTTPLWMIVAVLLALYGIWVALGVRRIGALADVVYRHGRAWWAAAAFLVIAGFAFGFWIRPELATYTSRGRPVFIEETMLRVSWYVSASGMVAACGGIVILLRHWLVDRRAAWLPFLSIVLAISFAYYWNPRVHYDHPWAMRRFVPAVLPGMAVGIAAAAAWLWYAGRGPWRLAARAAAMLVLGHIVVHEVRLALPFRNAPERAGALGVLAEMAGQVPAGSLLLYTQGIESWVATPLAFVWLRETLPILRRTRSDWDGENGRRDFETQVTAWLREGRDVLYLTRNEPHTQYLAHRLRWEPIQSFRFRTRGVSQNYLGPPRSPRVRDDTFHLFRLSRAGPPPPCAALSLDAGEPAAGRTQGFHGVESPSQGAFRWTEPLSRVLFPACDRQASGRPEALLLHARCSRARRSAPCAVQVTINGVPSGALRLGSRWEDHALPIPELAILEAAAPLDVRFKGPAFTPANRRDRRTLSFQVRRIALQGGEAHGRRANRDADRSQSRPLRVRSAS